MQRVSALCLLLFVFFVLLFLCFDPIRGYSQWKASLARPEATGALLAFVAALIAHMWAGLRDVLLDYARPAGLRGGLLLVVALGLFGLGACAFHRGEAARLSPSRNGLACITRVRDLREPVVICPLPGFRIVRDPVVDMTLFFKQYLSVTPRLVNPEPSPEKERLKSPAERDRLNGA